MAKQKKATSNSPAVPRKRGRPRKNAQAQPPKLAKKGAKRGRPRKAAAQLPVPQATALPVTRFFPIPVVGKNAGGDLILLTMYVQNTWANVPLTMVETVQPNGAVFTQVTTPDKGSYITPLTPPEILDCFNEATGSAQSARLEIFTAPDSIPSDAITYHEPAPADADAGASHTQQDDLPQVVATEQVTPAPPSET